MIVNGNTLKQCIDGGLIEVYRGKPEERLKTNQLTVGPNSIDVTLGDEILESVITTVLDPRDPLSVAHVQCEKWYNDKGAYLIKPRTVYLGYAAERFVVMQDLPIFTSEGTHMGGNVWNQPMSHLPVVQMLDGRSTVGRIGITVHVTAGFGDVGFEGNFTLEIVNLNDKPVLLYPGMRIGQVAFHCVSSSSSEQMTYNGAYKNDHVGRPVPPVLGPHRF